MSGNLYNYSPQRLINSNGVASGGQIYFYYTQTSVKASIYNDVDLTTPAPNPIVVDAGGTVPNVFLDPLVTYRTTIVYPNGQTETQDPVVLGDGTLREDLIGTAGAQIVGTANGNLQGILYSLSPQQPRKPYVAAEAGVLKGLAGIDGNFYNPKIKALRPVGGGGSGKTGLTIPYTDTSTIAALWMNHSATNAWYARWQTTGDETYRQRLIDDWNYRFTVLYPDVGMAIGGDGRYWPNDSAHPHNVSGTIATTFDDACWLARTHRQAYEAGVPDAGKYLVDTITNTLKKFLTTANVPVTTLISQAPNLTNINYNLGTTVDPQSGDTYYVGPPVQCSIYGSLYGLPSNPGYASIGLQSTGYEADLANDALFCYEKFGYQFMLDYAVLVWNFIAGNLLTPDPRAGPIDPVHSPTNAAARPAQYLVFADFVQDASVPNGDQYSVSLQPKNRWYGKPQRGVDATDLGHCMAFSILSARLYRLTNDDKYRTAAVNTANAIPNAQAYGRSKGAVTIIAQCRDPHSDGHSALDFVREVLTLDGINQSSRDAFIHSGEYITANCILSNGEITGDWAGPESDGTYQTWEAAYAVNGTYAGAAQIMTTSESTTFLIGCAEQAKYGSLGIPTPVSTGYDASGSLFTDKTGFTDTLSDTFGRFAIINKTYADATNGIVEGSVDLATAVQNAATIEALTSKYGTVLLRKGSSVEIGRRVSIPFGQLIGEAGSPTPVVYLHPDGFTNTGIDLTSRYGVMAVGLDASGNNDFVAENIHIIGAGIQGRNLRPILHRGGARTRILGIEIEGLSTGIGVCVASVTQGVTIDDIYGHDWYENSYTTLIQTSLVELDNDLVGNTTCTQSLLRNIKTRNIGQGPVTRAAIGRQTDGINIPNFVSGGHRITECDLADVDEAIDISCDFTTITNTRMDNNQNFGLKLIHGAQHCTATGLVILRPGIAGILFGTGTNNGRGRDVLGNTVSDCVVARVNEARNYDNNDTSCIRFDVEHSAGNGEVAEAVYRNLVTGGVLDPGPYGKYGVLASSSGAGGLNIVDGPLMIPGSAPNYSARFQAAAAGTSVRFAGTSTFTTSSIA